MHRTKQAKLIAIMLLAFLIALAGCSKNSSSSGNTPQPSGAASSGTPAASDKPKEPITLSVFIPLQATDVQYFNNLGETPVAKEIMKRTGINLKFIHPPVGQEKEQFNIMLASNDLPDVIVGFFDGYKGGPAQAIKDGLIIDTKDLVAKYAPNLQKILQADPMVAKMMKNDDGQLIGFGATVSNDLPFGQGKPYWGPMIRQDLLDKAGLAMPETIDDWYNVLKTLKAKFPELEAPLGFNCNATCFLVAAFGIPASDFYQENGVVKYAQIEPAYKKYLELLNKWYKEGLIQKDFATQNFNDHIMPMAQNGKIAAAYMHTYVFGTVRDKMVANGIKFVPAPLPVLQKGQQLHIRDDYGWFVDKGKVKYITTKNKYPAETIKLFDYLYSDEGKRLTNWGIEGESYTMVNGQPEFSDKYKAESAKIGALYMPNWLKQRIDMRQALMQYPLPEQKQAWDIWSKADTALKLPPGISFTTEEQAVNTKVMTDVRTYVDEMYLKFIMGVESLDKFDDYVKKVKSFKIDDVTKNYQTAMERLSKRQ